MLQLSRLTFPDQQSTPLAAKQHCHSQHSTTLLPSLLTFPSSSRLSGRRWESLTLPLSSCSQEC